eukprot:3447596-Rhodomonas_salina.1
MFKFGRPRQSRWEQEQAQLQKSDQKLAGVGIVLFMAPDHSLFVKSLVEGSGACNSGIMPGDCLMEVDGRNVYCKGTEVATKLILGPVGSVCVLKFSRIDDKSHKRIPITVNLVRELKATSTPQVCFEPPRLKTGVAILTFLFATVQCSAEERERQAAAGIPAVHSPRACARALIVMLI